MNLLRLSIRQTFGAIGIESSPARQEMRSPPGDLQIEQPPAEMNFSTEPSQLQIDSTDAQHALMRGPNLEWSSYLYGEMKSVFLKQLAAMVQEGSRMAQITNPANAFADLAREHVFRENAVNYQPVTPGYDNVRVSFDPGSVQTRIEPSHPVINYTPRKPEIDAIPGQTDIYLRQRNSIDITVSTYDLYR